MADNEAQNLKDAKKQYKLKIYCDGENPEEKGTVHTIDITLDGVETPWLIKCEYEPGKCQQFCNSMGVYHKVLKDFSDILDAVIVNVKQREALDKIVEKQLRNYLGYDMAHEGDLVSDPLEY